MTPEEAHMILAHDVLSLDVDDVPEVQGVVDAARAAIQKLQGKCLSATILSCWPDQQQVEQELYYTVKDLGLTITADELYTLVAQEFQQFVEFRLEHIYYFIAHSEEDWACNLRDEFNASTHKEATDVNQSS